MIVKMCVCFLLMDDWVFRVKLPMICVSRFRRRSRTNISSCEACIASVIFSRALVKVEWWMLSFRVFELHFIGGCFFEETGSLDDVVSSFVRLSSGWKRRWMMENREAFSSKGEILSECSSTMHILTLKIWICCTLEQLAELCSLRGHIVMMTVLHLLHVQIDEGLTHGDISAFVSVALKFLSKRRSFTYDVTEEIWKYAENGPRNRHKK